jgi:hypothetical protein
MPGNGKSMLIQYRYMPTIYSFKFKFKGHRLLKEKFANIGKAFDLVLASYNIMSGRKIHAVKRSIFCKEPCTFTALIIQWLD